MMTNKYYDDNLAFFKKYDSRLYMRLLKIKETDFQLIHNQIEDRDIFNVYSPTKGSFYNADAEVETKLQVENFLKKPTRFFPSGIFYGSDSLHIFKHFFRRLQKWSVENVEDGYNKKISSDSGVCIIIGLGLGYHIKELIDRLETRFLYILEDNLELLYYAMHVQNFAEISKKLEERGGKLRIFVDSDYSSVLNNAFDMMKGECFGIIDGAYIYRHIRSVFSMNATKKIIADRDIINANPGFFEDECIMFVNTIQTLLEDKAQIYLPKSVEDIDGSAIIVGAGPSLDDSIDFIKLNREKAVVFSCGTALRALLENNIYPDFHVELENTETPPRLLRNLHEKFDLSNIDLIGPTTLNKECIHVFNKAHLFFRDTVTPSLLIGSLYYIFLSAPTVGNTALRMSIEFGFRNIFLVGTDLGSRDAEKHHSKETIYMADASFLENSPEHKNAVQLGKPVLGNLGGEIYTSTSFRYSGVYMEHLLSIYSYVNVYNLSDGMKLEGTLPILPEMAEVKTLTSREAMLQAIKENSFTTAEEFGYEKNYINRFCEIVKQCLLEIIDIFEAQVHEDIDLYEFFLTLNTYFTSKSKIKIGAALNSMIRSPAMLMFQIAYIIIRRIDRETEIFTEFIKIFREDALKSLRAAYEYFTKLIDEHQDAIYLLDQKYGTLDSE